MITSRLDIAVIGQENSGKRSLIKAICHYLGSPSESSIFIGDGKTQLCFVPVDQLNQLRQDCYGVLIIFRIDDIESYKVAQEIARCVCDKFKFSSVVGTQRDRNEFRQVSVEQGKQLKKLANGAVFFEVSSATGENVVQLFK